MTLTSVLFAFNRVQIQFDIRKTFRKQFGHDILIGQTFAGSRTFGASRNLSIYPVQVLGDFGVDTRSVGSRATVAVRCDPVDSPLTICFLQQQKRMTTRGRLFPTIHWTLVKYRAHERSTAVAQTSISAASVVTSTEHVIRDFVQRQEQRSLPAFTR